MSRFIVTKSAFGLSIAVALFALTSVSLADFIGDTDGNTVTASAGGTFYQAYMFVANLTTGSGMTPSSPVTMASTESQDPSTMWATSSPSSDEMWVKFTFANLTSLSEMVVWNFNQNLNPTYPNLFDAGLKNVVITYSTGSDATGLGHSLYSGQLNDSAGGAAQGYTDDLKVSAANVKAVNIAYTSNWWVADDYSGYQYIYGLSEVRFAAATPEPSTLMLLATGLLGLLAYVWQKRR